MFISLSDGWQLTKQQPGELRCQHGAWSRACVSLRANTSSVSFVATRPIWLKQNDNQMGRTKIDESCEGHRRGLPRWFTDDRCVVTIKTNQLCCVSTAWLLLSWPGWRYSVWYLWSGAREHSWFLHWHCGKLLPCQIWRQLHILRCSSHRLITGFLHRTFQSQIQAVLVWVLAGLDSRQSTLRAGFVPWPTVSCALVHVEQSEKTWSGSSFLLLRTFWYMWLLHLFVEGIASEENAMFQVSVPHVVVEISN